VLVLSPGHASASSGSSLWKVYWIFQLLKKTFSPVRATRGASTVLNDTKKDLKLECVKFLKEKNDIDTYNDIKESLFIENYKMNLIL